MESGEPHGPSVVLEMMGSEWLNGGDDDEGAAAHVGAAD